MQTIDFIKTAEWIIEQFNLGDSKLLLTNELYRRGDEKDLPNRLPKIIKGSYDLILAIDKVTEHPTAPEILKQFGLDMLLDKNFPVEITETTVLTDSPNSGISKRQVDLWGRWSVFTKCIEPIKKLSIPQEIIDEQDFDDILTIELRYEQDFKPKIETVSEVLIKLTQLYNAVATAYGTADFSSLSIVYADSGSSFRLDFKGLGEPIRELKKLIVELWSRFRHRKAEDLRHNSQAFLEGLDAVSRIELLRQQNILTDEDARRYSIQIMNSAISLFEAGALPREIPRVETVSNQAILEGIYRKQLPPAPEQKENEALGIKRQTTKRKVRKTRKSPSKTK